MVLYSPAPGESEEGQSNVADATRHASSGFNLMLSFLGGRMTPLSKVLVIIQEAADVLLPDKEIEGNDKSEIYLEQAMVLCLKVPPLLLYS